MLKIYGRIVYRHSASPHNGSEVSRLYVAIQIQTAELDVLRDKVEAFGRKLDWQAYP